MPAAAEAEDVTAFFVWTDRRSGRFFVLRDGEQITLGRDADVCDVALMDPAASRTHCSLSKEGGVIRITDTGSSNGTFVNEERVQKAEIRPGDRLRIGTTRVYLSLPGSRK
jgi:pSer/pThr/pTyr-binding forkhead associated (FHA) protein